MSAVRFLASRPTWLLFWILMGADKLLVWVAGWLAKATMWIRGPP